MNTRESIDLLSDSLLDDERIVTPGERELLADLIRHSENNPHELSPAITQAIAEIAAEIIVQRAGTAMADNVVRKLTEQKPLGQRQYRESSVGGAKPLFSNLPPKPPGPTPPSPGPGPGGYRAIASNRMTLPPKPPGPTPPNPGPGPGGVYRMNSPKGILNLAEEEPTEVVPPKCVVLDEFLMPAELNDLLSYTLSREKGFIVSEVITPGLEGQSAVDFEYRRSHVLMDLGLHYDRMVRRLQSTLPRLLPKLGIEPFNVSRVEAQITASKDCDFFRWHTDNGHDEVSARKITFVYFFHREPKAFAGGELRIRSLMANNADSLSGNYYTIAPRQNQLVLFESSLMHEIAPVKCPSGKFGDSRFTVNGWVSR